MKKLIFLMFFGFCVNAFASFNDCGKYVGSYQSMDSRNRSLKISLTAKEIVIDYNRDPQYPSKGYSLRLIADGVEHVGNDPKNTGTSYSFSCTPNYIELVRFGFLKSPLTTTISVEESVLTEMATIENRTYEMGKYKQRSPSTNGKDQ